MKHQMNELATALPKLSRAIKTSLPAMKVKGLPKLAKAMPPARFPIGKKVGK